MTAQHLEILVEERSMEIFLRALLSRVLPEGCSFNVHAFQGKPDLLDKLEERLRGYARWLPEEIRLVVVVDRDDDDCGHLKERLERIAGAAKLRTRSEAGSGDWQVVNRLAIEELEAWYFGDWEAVRAAYPKVSPNVPDNKRYRDPDAIHGGTWEAFEKVLQRAGYFKTGLRKGEAAAAIGAHLDPSRSRSRSFGMLHEAVLEATGYPP